jgi:hypothetical protein
LHTLDIHDIRQRGGCDRQTINRLERAHHSGSLDHWLLVAAAFGMSLADLIIAGENIGHE